MKRKKIASKWLSLMLSAAVIVSSSFGGITLVDVNATEVPVEESVAVSDNSTEDVVDVQDSDLAETETPVAEETEATEETTVVTDETVADEESAETEETEMQDPESEDEVSEEKMTADADDVQVEKVTDTSTLVDANLVADANLRKVLLSVYNNMSTDDITASEFTLGDLQEIKGVLNVATAATAAGVTPSSIKSCKGIGYVSNATVIDLGQTGVTVIEASEFENNTVLTEIVLPDAVTGIGNDAFKSCTALEHVNVYTTKEVADTLPSKLVDNATKSNIFNGCIALKAITLPDFSNPAALQFAAGMFMNCAGLETVVISANVSVIPNTAFFGAGNAEKGMTVTIKEGSKLGKIDDGAFQYANMAAIDLSNCSGLYEIGNRSFSALNAITSKGEANKIALKEMILPAKVSASGVSIGDEAFFKTQIATIAAGAGTEAVGKVVLPNYVTKLGKAAFYGNESMKSLELSANLEKINEFTFWGCTKLASVKQNVVNNNCAITSIANMAFYNTGALADANFLQYMNKLTVIGEEDFEVEVRNEDEDIKVEELDYFKDRSKSKKYGSYVFYGSGIASAVLPASLRTIKASAFANATKLASVTWKSDSALAAGQQFTVGTEAFAYCSKLEKFYYPKTAGKGASFVFKGRCFAKNFMLKIFSQEGTTNTNGSANAMPVTLTKLGGGTFVYCQALPAMAITDNEAGVSPEIGAYMFLCCMSLAKAELPSKLEVIPQHMYYDCALTAFPAFKNNVNSLKIIEAAAFFGNRMETIDLSKITNLAQIGDVAFGYVDTVTLEKEDDYNVADELALTDYVSAPLKKVILPDGIVGTGILKLGDNVFQGAKSLTTMETPSHRMASGGVYIPNYITVSSCGVSMFADTGVSKVEWGYTKVTSGANKWTKIPAGMFAMTKIVKLEDACLPASDLEEIGSNAYVATLIENLDLSQYTNLKEIGEAAFALSWKMKKITLPTNEHYKKVADLTFHIGSYENEYGIKDIPGMGDKVESVLTEIDFGGVTELGKNSFSCLDEDFDEKSNEGIWKSVLQKLDFSATKVAKIGENAFAGRQALKELKLDGVSQVGAGAFMLCTALNMSQTPIADSVTTIGDKAFYRDSALGKVTFGAGITSIGKQAFAECAGIDKTAKAMDKGVGLVAVDFSKATKLATIGEEAFHMTAIQEFDITATALKELKTGAIAECPHLQVVKLNQELQKIGANAVYGCVDLSRFEFYSTTTIHKNAFQKKGTFVSDGSYSTPISTKTTFVLNPVELNVGIGNEMTFPYYVCSTDVSTGEFGAITIGNENNPDANIHRYVKVFANTSGYYRNDASVESNKITDSKYFEKIDAVKYSVNGETVYTFKIAGLEKTPANTMVPFTITNGYTFASAEFGTFEKTMTITYNLKVMDIPYYPVLYTNSGRTTLQPDMKIDKATGMTVGETTIRVNKSNTSGKTTLYYDFENVLTSNWQPNNGNLIIKTSNPAVLGMTTGTSKSKHVKKVDDFTWKVTAEYDNKTGVDVSAVTKDKVLEFVPKSTGDAVITIYPEGCPAKTITWTVHVKADISSITLSAPSEAKNGVQLYQKFSIVEKVAMYLSKSVNREDGTLGDLVKYTDNKITYSSDNPKVASIDANGMVTINQVSKTKVPVVFTATVALSTGGTLVKTLSFNVVYPTLSKDKAVTDHTGTTVKVTATGSAPTVTYVSPAPTATTVTIPSTMQVNGVQCKVTAVAEGAFENNKTVQNVTIGSGIKVIPKNMFKGCTKLKKVTIKGKVTSIGEGAFSGCKALTAITIPKTVKIIGKKAFYNCKKLSKVTFKKGSKLTEIGASAFQSCGALKSISIPSKSLKKIGAKAFYKCSKLKKITVKSTKVTSVGKNAFKSIYKTAVIDVPNGKLGTYKKLFKKGQGKKVKIK